MSILESNTRKYFGKRHVEKNVTGARLVVLESLHNLRPSAHFKDAVILSRVYDALYDTDFTLYATMKKSGALAILREGVVTGSGYFVREDFSSGFRGEALPFLEVFTGDGDAIVAAFARNASVTLASTP